MRNKEISLYTKLKLLITLASILAITTACGPTGASLAAEPSYIAQSKISVCTSPDPALSCLRENGVEGVVVNASNTDGTIIKFPTDKNGEVYLPYPEYTNWQIDPDALSILTCHFFLDYRQELQHKMQSM
jgi:hypothetical protein